MWSLFDLNVQLETVDTCLYASLRCSHNQLWVVEWCAVVVDILEGSWNIMPLPRTAAPARTRIPNNCKNKT